MFLVINVLFTLVLLALGINFVVYVLYQLIWGHKPLKALVGGAVGSLVIALYGGQLLSGSTLAQASTVISPFASLSTSIGFLGLIVGGFIYGTAFDWKVFGWWGRFYAKVTRYIEYREKSKTK